MIQIFNSCMKIYACIKALETNSFSGAATEKKIEIEGKVPNSSMPSH